MSFQSPSPPPLLGDQELDDDSIRNNWVLFKLCDKEFGFPTRYVIQMVNLPRFHNLPDQPEYIRGAMNLRGEIITLIQTDRLIGTACAKNEYEELIDSLNAREQDHINWLNELFLSVKEHREFKLTTDPHACAFGKWYDHFKTSNSRLEEQLEKFDKPHKAIHAVAQAVASQVEVGDMDRAQSILARAKETTLSELKTLFAETRNIVLDSMMKVVIVARVKNQKFGYIVDSVTEVRDIDEATISLDQDGLDSMIHSEYLHGIGKIEDRLIYLINQDALE